jgi:hypothetical protein
MPIFGLLSYIVSSFSAKHSAALILGAFRTEPNDVVLDVYLILEHIRKSAYARQHVFVRTAVISHVLQLQD